MKKKLLILGTITMLTSAFNAQNSVVYVGDGGKLFVSGSALVYSGGNWEVDSDKEKTVENKGNIIIVGDYKRGSTVNAAQDGKEFVNVYTDPNNYGQVKLLNATGTSDAKMTIQRPAANANYYDSWFPISLPYKDNVSYLMKSFGLQESDFRGKCNVNAFCGPERYRNTILKWNNDKIVLDAVPESSQFKAGDYYNLNLTKDATNVKNKMIGNIAYKGTPDGRAYTQDTSNRTIHGVDVNTFNNLTYNEWKVKENAYREKYETYMGRANTTSKVFSKNIFRFGNPYTSNLDLSAFDGGDAWVTINGSATIKQAYDRRMIKNFSITKRMSSYNSDWGINDGYINSGRNYYEAKFDGTRWAGSAEALLIRPTETFNLNFPVINPTVAGSRLLNVSVNFTDKHKTFDYVPSAKNATNPGLAMIEVSYEPMGMMMLADDVAFNNIQRSNFYQLEIALIKDNKLQEAPVYIIGANDYKESGANATNGGNIFVYGVKDGEVVYNSQKNFNEFNSDTYVGKPLGLGLKVQEGQTYQLRFALYEDNIFNKVAAFTNGVFYLKDNVTKKVTKVNPNEAISFVADANSDKRFEFYWKQAPQGETTSTLVTTELVEKSQESTRVYRDGGVSKVRFENIADIAKVEVFNIAGRLVSSNDRVSTSTDYTLNLGYEGLYMVKVIYQNGEVRTLKVINN